VPTVRARDEIQDKGEEMKLIKNVERIIELAKQRKSILLMPRNKKIAAAFIQNWQGRLLYNCIKLKSFYEDTK
jgi:hypothetical protein